MREARKCVKCGAFMRPNWKLRFCPTCGGRVVACSPDELETVSLMESAEDGFPFFFRFPCLSPFFLFLFDILTLGIRTILWTVDYLQYLTALAEPQEKIGSRPLYLWIAAHAVMLASVAWATGVFFHSGFEVAVLMNSYALRIAAVFLFLGLAVSRHLFFWIREVIIDGLAREGVIALADADHAFASSPLLLWFVGAPYLQMHVNRTLFKAGF